MRGMLPDPPDNQEAGRTRKVNIALSPDILTGMARGFSCLFWGLPISLLLFFGTLELRVLPRWRIPAYVLGVIIIFYGLLLLQRAGPLTVRWSRRLFTALILVLIQVYMVPFVYWWRQMPHVPYLIANMALLIICTTWVLFVINRLAGEIAKILHDVTFFMETQLSGWAAIIFILIPAGYFIYQAVQRNYNDAGFISLSPFLWPIKTPDWFFISALLPFTLTMAIVWKAKEKCLTVLKSSTRIPLPGQAPSM